MQLNHDMPRFETHKIEAGYMITKKELHTSPEYWLEMAQNELFRQLSNFMQREGLNQSQLAEKLGVSKGYISQVLNGNFNYKLRTLVELSIAIGKAPVITYKALDDFKPAEKKTTNVIASRRVKKVRA